MKQSITQTLTLTLTVRDGAGGLGQGGPHSPLSQGLREAGAELEEQTLEVRTQRGSLIKGLRGP